MNSTREVFKYMDCSRFGGRHLDFTLKGTWEERGKIPVGPLSETSGRKNVMSMRELFCPDPPAGFEKMAGFQIFYCLKIKCFHS